MADDRRTKRGPYAKTAATREKILDACEEVFAEKGYRAATVKEIAERAQISVRGLVHHFPDKDALLTGLLARHETQSALALTGRTDANGVLVLIEQEESLSERPHLLEVQAILMAEATNPQHPAHAHFARRYEGLRAYAGEALRALEVDDRLPADLTVDDLADAFVALTDGLHLQWLMDRSRPAPATLLRKLTEALLHDPSEAARS